MKNYQKILIPQMIFPTRQELIIPFTASFLTKALLFSQKYEVCCLTDGNQPMFTNYPQQPFKTILAIGNYQNNNKNVEFSTNFEELATCNEWLFGFFGYDMKNQTENLVSQHVDHLEFPEMYFFVPQHIIFFEETQIKIISFGNIARILEEIDSQVITTIPKKNIPQTHKISTNFSKSYYLNTVEKIKQHIIEGDVYELNFCMGFFIENIEINPLETYLKLKQVSPMPFSAFLKLKDRYVLCASPERFLKKEGIKIISQPIKGTIRRGKDENEDDILKKELRNSEKELAENMMIVDLVRNDLARTAKTGSIKATELFGIYTFPQVHQMISTIEAAMNVENNAQTEQGRREAIEFIKNAFPMGSMTGAPKIKAMELIENYEKSKRGVFSGTIGYINPVGDFDFNVVIRSIFYNSSKNYLGFQAGSAITYDSIAEQEYEECLLKTKAIREII